MGGARGREGPAETWLGRAGCAADAAPSRGLSRALQLSPSHPGPGRRLCTHQSTRCPQPACVARGGGGALGARPSSAQRPARSRSLTLGTRGTEPAPGRAGATSVRSRPPASLRLRLPPALRAAAPLPAAPPPRRPLPSPPLPPLRGAPHRRLPLPLPGAPSRPARGGPCGSLTPPLPRRPGGRGRGLGLRHPPRGGWASGGQASRDVEGGTKPRALSPNPDAPMPPALPGVGAEEAGRGRKRTAVGKGRPAQPPARVPVFETNRSHGANRTRGRASSCGQRGAQTW